MGPGTLSSANASDPAEAGAGQGGDGQGTSSGNTSSTGTSSGTSSSGTTSGSTSGGTTSGSASACNVLAPVTGATAVTPKFVVIDSTAGVAPPTLTGGTLSGRFIANKATVYLPAATKPIAKPATSTGTITAWAEFDGTHFREAIVADLTIDTLLGPNKQSDDVENQGLYATSNAALQFTKLCTDAGATTPTMTYQISGTSGELLVKLTTPAGDAYLLLEATVSP
jgi:hypothetical protein